METLHLKKQSRSISSFLKKTYEMLQDSENDLIVKWTPNGVGFMILDEIKFSKTILPKYFKHNKYSSFVRQLNMYNFHKVRSNVNQNCFIHECFVRNDLKSIENIKRKVERKKKKDENDSLSFYRNEQYGQLEQSQSEYLTKPKTNSLGYYYSNNHKISNRIAHKSLNNNQVLLLSQSDQINTNQQNSNTVNQKQSPVTGIQLEDSDDNISIIDGMNMIERSQMKIPTRFLLQNQGSGIFPLNTEMISIYSMSSLIK